MTDQSTMTKQPLYRELIVHGTLDQLTDLLEFEKIRASNPYGGSEGSVSNVLPFQLYGPIHMSDGSSGPLRWLVVNGYSLFLNSWKEGKDVAHSGPNAYLKAQAGMTLDDLDRQARQKGTSLGALLRVPELWITQLPNRRLRLIFGANRSADRRVFWSWVDSLVAELQRQGFAVSDQVLVTNETRGIARDVWEHLRIVLSKCDQFAGVQELKSLFVDPRLQQFRDRVPEINNVGGRVEAVLSLLTEERNAERNLVVLVEAVRDGVHPDDACYGQLSALLRELEAGMKPYE
jgi:hypothetical protein